MPTHKKHRKAWKKKYLGGLLCHDLPSDPMPELGVILVTGATGYIGGRLVPELHERGYKLRLMVRGDLAAAREKWKGIDVVEADALDKDSLLPALEDVYAAYYLIHSLLLGPDGFEQADIKAAENFRDAAEEAGVKRIIYLGGLGDTLESRSHHLRNRMRVAEALSAGNVPVTTIRAGIIIGSGSASYEIIYGLVNRMKLIVLPPHARNRCQPIGIRDVIKYLVGVLETPVTKAQMFDAGGMDVLTYEDVLRKFARVLRKKVLFIKFPLASVRLNSYIASLITPVPKQIVQCLMEGLRDEVVCKNEEITKFVPFRPLGFREAVVRALTREQQDRVATRWSDAYPPAHELALKLHELDGKPDFVASYSLVTGKQASALFKSFCAVGGKKGWFHSSFLWRIRGLIDKLILGVGTSRGRRSASSLAVGDVIDFWRVEDLRENERLLLRAEMKVPGRAWLEFSVTPDGNERRLNVTAYFDSFGLMGRFYWYLFLPFHNYIFNDLIRMIEKRA